MTLRQTLGTLFVIAAVVTTIAIVASKMGVTQAGSFVSRIKGG